MYVTFDYYANTFGGSMEEDAFSAAERAAEAYVRYLTFPNGNIFAIESDFVKDAICAAADAYHEVVEQAASSGGHGPIQSESNDGYSVSYVSQTNAGETTEALRNRKMYEAARVYLVPAGWLSRRVGCRCDCADSDNAL